MPQIACVVLAAGAGARFGDPGDKLLSKLADKPLLQHAVDAACGSSASACSIIVGAAAGRVIAGIDARRAAIYRNDAWPEGLSRSIRLAVEIHMGCDACIFVLGDAPYVRAQDLDALIGAWQHDRRSVVALRSGTVWGAPALFPRTDFPALRRLEGDHGAKTLAQRHLRSLRFVEAVDPRAFIDVDRPAKVRPRSETRTPRIRPSRAPR